MRKAHAKDKRLLVALHMPPLRKKPFGGTYSSETDKVLSWIAQQPALLSYIFDKLNQAGYIIYDSEDGTWQGVEYDD